MMNIKPLDFIEAIWDRLYVIMEEKAGKIGKIELPESTRMRNQIGVVHSIGEQVKGIKVGDRVLLSYGAGRHIQLPETYSVEPFHRIICDHEILCKVKTNENP